MRITVLDNNVKSAWEWDINNVLCPKTFIKDAVDLNIKRIYITCSTGTLKTYGNEYDNFIKLAAQNGIWVEALCGDAPWALECNCHYTEDFVNTVLDFNTSHYNKFSAVHLDIEPHCLADWDINKEDYMTQYIKNMQEIRRIIDRFNSNHNSNVGLTVVQPRWIWQVNDINGNPVLPQLMSIVNEIAVMDYTVWMDDYILNGLKFLELADVYNTEITIGSEFLTTESVSLSMKTSLELEDYFTQGLKQFKLHPSFKQLGMHSVTFYKEYLESN
jgi:hypothetical protein